MSITGIIGAMEEEIYKTKPYIKNSRTEYLKGMEFFIGKIGGNDVVLVRSGIGKVNATICTQVLIDKFNVDSIINVGVAGAIGENLEIGDIVISTDLMHHDVDTTAFGEGIGIIPRMKTSNFEADEKLIKLAKECAEHISTTDIHIGRIVSGDQFISDGDLKASILSNFNPLCVDMESAAIGQTCYVNNIPFVAIRSISDSSDDSKPYEYENFYKDSALRASAVINEMVSKINDK